MPSVSYAGAPVVFISGDQGPCDYAVKTNANIQAVAVKEGVGEATININPALAVSLIRVGVTPALQGDPAKCCVPLPQHFSVEMRHRKHIRQTDPFTVQYDTDDYFTLLSFLCLPFNRV